MQVEALALLQGVIFLKELGIREANILGDSQVIIRAVVTNSNPTNLHLARLLTRIKSISKSLHLTYFHVLRTNNKAADTQANIAVHLDAGTILRNKESLWATISWKDMFYYFLLNQFVCIFHLGQSASKEHFENCKKRKWIRAKANPLLVERHVGNCSSFCNRICGHLPSR